MSKKTTTQSPPVLANSNHSVWIVSKSRTGLAPFRDDELCSSCGDPAYGWVLPSKEDDSVRPSRKCKRCFQISLLKATLGGKEFVKESEYV